MVKNVTLRSLCNLTCASLLPRIISSRNVASKSIVSDNVGDEDGIGVVGGDHGVENVHDGQPLLRDLELLLHELSQKIIQIVGIPAFPIAQTPSIEALLQSNLDVLHVKPRSADGDHWKGNLGGRLRCVLQGGDDRSRLPLVVRFHGKIDGQTHREKAYESPKQVAEKRHLEKICERLKPLMMNISSTKNPKEAYTK